MDVDGVRVDVLAVPIAGPSISFRDAYRMVERLGPSTAIPIHHDVFVADPRMFADRCGIARVIVLDDGESTTV
ncbi:hypothetical protein [Euzebya sp.]|uniref:hypothetical protein n=1 Tax=Euzebya sp. TaxID=1971409 RepID=UPI0035123912